jgi:hypothetical protein
MSRNTVSALTSTHIPEEERALINIEETYLHDNKIIAIVKSTSLEIGEQQS